MRGLSTTFSLSISRFVAGFFMGKSLTRQPGYTIGQNPTTIRPPSRQIKKYGLNILAGLPGIVSLACGRKLSRGRRQSACSVHGQVSLALAGLQWANAGDGMHCFAMLVIGTGATIFANREAFLIATGMSEFNE
jgi:uncharacterized Zn-binding protein involved in type VI secretion